MIVLIGTSGCTPCERLRELVGEAHQLRPEERAVQARREQGLQRGLVGAGVPGRVDAEARVEGVQGPGHVVEGRDARRVAAQLDRSRLEADGLSCFVQGGGLGSLLPTATVFPILLQVRAADRARAEEILADTPAGDELPSEDAPADPDGSF